MKEHAPIKITRRKLLRIPFDHATDIAYAVGDIGAIAGGISLGFSVRKTFDAKKADEEINPSAYYSFRPGSGIYIRSTATPAPTERRQELIQQSEESRKQASNLFHISILSLPLMIPAFFLLLKEASRGNGKIN